MRFLQLYADLLRRSLTEKAALVHDQHPACNGKGLLQPMLAEDNGRAHFPIDSTQQSQKFRGGDGIQLRGGLVQNQHIRLHGHDTSKAQKLLLATGQLADRAIEPSFDVEEGGNLGHSAANGGGIKAEAFQPKCQFVPHFIGNHLIFR